MELKKVVEKLRPNEEPILKDVNKFLDKLNTIIKEKKLKAEAVAGGSTAKRTFLKGDHDVDIFVKFSKDYKTDKLAFISNIQRIKA